MPSTKNEIVYYPVDLKKEKITITKDIHES